MFNPTATVLNVKGFKVYKDFIPPSLQQELVTLVRSVATASPFFSPVTPGGKPMSVKMTSAGRLGWVTDRRGYRYDESHPNGQKWPPIPRPVLEIWKAVSETDRSPDSCLINFYGEGARMGLHQDRDEGDFSFPVVSISLGDDALFRMGGTQRTDRTESIWLSSGDVVVMGGAARLAWHGVDKIRFGSSQLLPKSGRINLTLRAVSNGSSAVI